MTSTPALQRLERTYITVVISLGVIAIGQSLVELSRAPIGSEWLLLAVLTLVSGSASVKLPGSHASISISEAFVFTAVLLYGPAAGTLTVTLDALVISFWIARRRPEPIRALINISAPAFSAWLSARIFFWTAGIVPLVDKAVSLNEIIPPLALFALTYFALNSWLIACVIAFEKRQNPFQVWRRGFLWLSLNYFCGASLAILLVGNNRAIDLRFVGAIIPLLLVLYFTYKTSMERVHDANKHVDQLNSLYISTVETLAMAIDAKDQVTHGHIRRVQQYAVGLARVLGVADQSLLKAIEAAALLHDMGKLAVPEYILNKPGKLTDAEFEKMKLHASVGADILSAIAFPYPVVPIVRHHHENWDGSGYPQGLSATAIPIGARILSVVDCFDALTSDRPYRPRMTDDEAVQILLQRRGSMYDPLIVDTFVMAYEQLGNDLRQMEPGPDRAHVATDQIADGHSHSEPAKRLDQIAASSAETLTMYELSGLLAGQSTLANMIDVISTHVKRLIPSSLFVFYEYDTRNDILEAVHVVGDDHSLIKGMKISLGTHLSGWVAANRQTIINSDAVLDLGEIARTSEPRLKHSLSTPVTCDDALIGVLTLYSTAAAAFDDNHKRIIEAIGGQISNALKGGPHVASISDRDAADVLLTRSHLDQMLNGASRKGGVTNAPITMLLITLSRAADAGTQEHSLRADILDDVARRLMAALRHGDRLYRYSQNEFIAVLDAKDVTPAGRLTVDVRRRALLECISLSRGDSIDITVMRLPLPKPGESIDQLIEQTHDHSSRLSHEATSSIH